MKRNSYIEGLGFELPHPFRVDSDRLNNKFETDTIVDNKGVVRWKTNNSVPPRDVLEFWEFQKKPFNFDVSCVVLEKETNEFLSKYRESMKDYEPTEEEKVEMRSAFGNEKTVVNIITGKKINL